MAQEIEETALAVIDPPPAQEQHQIVVASNPAQMQVAQAQLVAWCDGKLVTLATEAESARENLAAAKLHKWRHTPFQRQLDKVLDQIIAYEKVKAALQAGYTIIPNIFDVDVFAIRTTRDVKGNYAAQPAYHGRVIPNDQASNKPPLGEGKFVNAEAKYVQEKVVTKYENNDLKKPVYEERAWAIEHNHEIEFPFKLVKPEIMHSTKKAMQALCFDDVACYPPRKRKRRGDPMIIGRIHGPKQTLSFLITWFISTKDL